MGLTTLISWLLSIITIPYILLSGLRYLEGLLMDLLADQLQAEILDPSPPDRYSVLSDGMDDLFDRLEKVINIRRGNLHTWSGKVISRILGFLGWSWVNHRAFIDNHDSRTLDEAEERDRPMQERVPQDYMTSVEQHDNSHSATLSFTIHEIVNTSESALPILSSAEGANEISENVLVASRSEMLQRGRLQRNSSSVQLYRRTDLSEAPSAGLVPLLSENLTSLLLLPAKAAILKHVVQTFIDSPLTTNVNGLSLVCMQPLPPFRGILVKPLKFMKVTNFVFYLQRFALASVLKLVADLGWWTCEWAAVTWVGRRLFNWGNL